VAEDLIKRKLELVNIIATLLDNKKVLELAPEERAAGLLLSLESENRNLTIEVGQLRDLVASRTAERNSFKLNWDEKERWVRANGVLALRIIQLQEEIVLYKQEIDEVTVSVDHAISDTVVPGNSSVAEKPIGDSDHPKGAPT